MFKWIKSGQVYVSQNEDVYKVRLGNGLFICGFDISQKRSFCLWSSQCLTGVELLRLLVEKVSWLRTGASKTSIKIIVDAEHTNELKLVFEKLNVFSLKVISRDDVGQSLFFYAADGRLRAEKGVEKTLPKNTKKKIKVLVIDDSMTIHKLLTHIFKKSDTIEVVGAVLDPFKVEDAILRHNPDVLTVDIHMEGMNGVQLLRKILPRYPIPSLLVTSLSINDGPLVLEGLQVGAVDHLQKPTIENMDHFAEDIVEKVKAVASAQVRPPVIAKRKTQSHQQALDSNHILAMGASTGGTEALAQMLAQWPSKSPPILIVQHIPAQFSTAFAQRLNQICHLTVLEAQHDMPVKKDHVYVAPGGLHMRLAKNESGGFKLQMSDGEAVNRHKPSVDVLFQSILDVANPRQTTAVLLTGMGSDGARGLLEMKKAGAHTFAQDQASCVVYGMPKVALEMGAVDQMLSLEELPQAILNHLSLRRAA